MASGGQDCTSIVQSIARFDRLDAAVRLSYTLLAREDGAL